VNKPKRSTSAYFYYLAHCREQANKQGRSISKIAEFTKECSAKWREMVGPQKKPFEEMAAKDKARYEREMAAYKGKKTDPNKPKRPMTVLHLPGRLPCQDEGQSTRSPTRSAVSRPARSTNSRWPSTGRARAKQQQPPQHSRQTTAQMTTKRKKMRRRTRRRKMRRRMTSKHVELSDN